MRIVRSGFFHEKTPFCRPQRVVNDSKRDIIIVERGFSKMTTLKASAVQISLVGASALNQALKACIVARRFLKDDEVKSDIVIQPEFLMQNFSEPESESREVTTIMLHIRKVDFDPEHAVSSDVPKHEDLAA